VGLRSGSQSRKEFILTAHLRPSFAGHDHGKKPAFARPPFRISIDEWADHALIRHAALSGLALDEIEAAAGEGAPTQWRAARPETGVAAPHPDERANPPGAAYECAA